MEPIAEVASELEERVRALGYDLVDVEWGGTRTRPVLRLRVDHLAPDLESDRGVTVDECAEVSRGLEPWLDGLEELSARYRLEVSSPGVERPLRRTRDYLRFLGHEIAVKSDQILAGRATYLEGELVGVEEAPGGPGSIHLRLAGGDEVEIPRARITGAHLLFRWR